MKRTVSKRTNHILQGYRLFTFTGTMVQPLTYPRQTTAMLRLSFIRLNLRRPFAPQRLLECCIVHSHGDPITKHPTASPQYCTLLRALVDGLTKLLLLPGYLGLSVIQASAPVNRSTLKVPNQQTSFQLLSSARRDFERLEDDGRWAEPRPSRSGAHSVIPVW